MPPSFITNVRKQLAPESTNKLSRIDWAWIWTTWTRKMLERPKMKWRWKRAKKKSKSIKAVMAVRLRDRIRNWK